MDLKCVKLNGFMDLKIPSYLLQHVPVGYAYGYFLNHLKLQ